MWEHWLLRIYFMDTFCEMRVRGSSWSGCAHNHLSSSSSLLLSILELSDTKVSAPSIRALLRTNSHFCGAIPLHSRTFHGDLMRHQTRFQAPCCASWRVELATKLYRSINPTHTIAERQFELNLFPCEICPASAMAQLVHTASLSHMMYLSISFRKSTPPQTVNLLFKFETVTNKLTILWGSWLSKNHWSTHRIR